ncbi:MAG TPA: hypothetical protein VF747_05190, partial [Blastocatellia bacterium]
MTSRAAAIETTSYKLLALRLREKKSILITLVLSFIGTAAIYISSKGGTWIGIIAPGFIILGAVLLVAACRNWELGLQSLLVVVIIEGAIRKWFLPSASELVYFYKDALMVIILVAYKRQNRKTPF